MSEITQSSVLAVQKIRDKLHEYGIQQPVPAHMFDALCKEVMVIATVQEEVVDVYEAKAAHARRRERIAVAALNGFVTAGVPLLKNSSFYTPDQASQMLKRKQGECAAAAVELADALIEELDKA